MSAAAVLYDSTYGPLLLPVSTVFTNEYEGHYGTFKIHLLNLFFYSPLLSKFVVVSSSICSSRSSINSFLSRFSSPPDCFFSRLISEGGRFEELEKGERSFVKYEH
ncbi:hypothetical protein V6N13_018859 [Hibiscus sabdariffa]|uniref:Uncharacterized protein n=1 Tax=Hibiscus sabdariffa TaxID=183260 RepID=A0ABR2EKN5_9ROSI